MLGFEVDHGHAQRLNSGHVKPNLSRYLLGERCKGEGVEMDEDGETLDCALCQGEGEVTVSLKRNVPCPDCQE